MDNSFAILRRAYFLAAFSCALVGCSSSSSSPMPEEGPGVTHRATVADGTPVAVEVEDLANDGRMLHVVVKITNAAPFLWQDSALRLAGFGNGALIRENIQPLEKALVSDSKPEGTYLPAGSISHAYLALPVEGIANYQVELLWGADARNVLVAKGAVTPTPRLVIQNVGFEPSSDCPLDAERSTCPAPRVRAELVNGGQGTIVGAEVLLSLVSQAKTLDSSDAEGETSGVIRMRPLRISPGGKQSVRLVVPVALYEQGRKRFGADLVPHLMVRSVETSAPENPDA